MKTSSAMKPKLLVFINKPPWNELILRGRAPVKHGGNKINHTGLVLLYTSKSKPDPDGLEEFDEQSEVNTLPRGVLVGACLFRCVAAKGGAYEYHLSNAHRFPEPVPITKHGPVRFYSTEITPAIERQLRTVGLWDEALASDRNTRSERSQG
jgi:hypothetical protein